MDMREKYTGRSEPIINKPSDIPKGLVAKRKAELLLAKLEEAIKAQESLNRESESHAKEDNSESLKPRLTHPTSERPKINHRPPSSFSYTNSESTLFISPKEEKLEREEPSLSISSDKKKVVAKSSTSIWTELIAALSRAVDNYSHKRMEGTTPSEAYGWFSWLRHGKAGEDKAGELASEARGTSTVDSLLTLLHHFFADSNTRYNNHSLAPYVMDELNKLLIQYALKPFILSLGTQYDLNSWVHIKNQLSQLAGKEVSQERQSLVAPM
ncbi:TPA: Dot/Icm T4SS effector MavH [Legionella pneumophila]